MSSEYDRLQKKYNLPSFETLDNELDLSDYEEPHNPLRFIVNRMGERLEFFADMLGKILQPDSDPSSMYECNAFSDADREKVPELFKKIMYLHREFLERGLSYNEAEYAQFILHFFEEWSSLKKELAGIFSIMKSSWKQQNKLKLDLEYYG